LAVNIVYLPSLLAGSLSENSGPAIQSFGFFVDSFLLAIAFTVVAVAGFYMASRLKRANADAGWSSSLGAGALLCSLVWLMPVLYYEWFFDFLTHELSYSATAVELITVALNLLVFTVLIVAAIIFLVAVSKANGSFRRKFISGRFGAILFLLFVSFSFVFTTEIFPYFLTPSQEAILPDFTYLEPLFFLLLLFFSALFAIFFFMISKQLRAGNRGQSRLYY